MIDVIEALAPYVPLFQTIIWFVLVVASLLIFRKQVKSLADVVRVRIEKGSHLKAGPIELGQDVSSLEYIKKGHVATERGRNGANDRTVDEWQTLRRNIYQHNRDIFLAHVIRPSEIAGQKFDVFIYLVRHEQQDFSDIEYAEFYFGKHWGNRIIQKQEKDGLIGVATSALGSYLCTCRVTFKDGKKIDLDRYIDFEMSRVFDLES